MDRPIQLHNEHSPDATHIHCKQEIFGRKLNTKRMAQFKRIWTNFVNPKESKTSTHHLVITLETSIVFPLQGPSTEA